MNEINNLKDSINIIGSIPRKKRRCYTMIGFRESFETAEKRLEMVYNIGFMPFAQLYQPIGKKKHYSEKWHLLAKKWSRPAIYESLKNKKYSDLITIEQKI